MAENGRSVESFLPRTLTTYEIGVPFVNRLFTASANCCTEFVCADHLRAKSCSAPFGAGAQPERAIAESAIKHVRMVWMANYLFRRKEFGLSAYWPRNAELLATALIML
jgi:hypothetical protein